MKILIAEPKDFSPQAIESLKKLGQVDMRPLRQEELKATFEQYDVVWVRLHLTVRKQDLPAQPKTRIVVSATTGLDHLDLVSLEHRGIRVVSLKGEHYFLKTIRATAEHTLAMMLALVRHIPAAQASVLDGRWERDLFKGHELHEKTLGIIGWGRLGQQVGAYAHALGMTVRIVDPYVTAETSYVEQVADLGALVSSSDIISIHVPLNDETEGLIDRSLLFSVREGAILINTSRGGIVDEKALLEALEQGRLSGAAVDVLQGEPHITENHPLVRYAREHSNLHITPHIGGCTWESMQKCEEHLAKQVSAISESV